MRTPHTRKLGRRAAALRELDPSKLVVDSSLSWKRRFAQLRPSSARLAPSRNCFLPFVSQVTGVSIEHVMSRASDHGSLTWWNLTRSVVERFHLRQRHSCCLTIKWQLRQGECGDIIQNGLRGGQIQELGTCLPTQGCASNSVSGTAPHRFRGGLVVYKSIGVGITDLVAASFIIEVAMKMGKGPIVSRI